MTQQFAKEFIFYNPRITPPLHNAMRRQDRDAEQQLQYLAALPHSQELRCRMDFYIKAFGAAERMRMARADGRTGHAEIQIGDSTVMMADEHPEIFGFSPEHYGGSPVSFHFYMDNCDQTYGQALAAGAKSVRKPDQLYGDRNAGVVDPFGYKWWIATDAKRAQGCAEAAR